MSDIARETLQHPTTPNTYEQTKGRLDKAREYYNNGTLINGEDYGIVPGTSSKPTLFKPGAQKLCALFDLASEIKGEPNRVISDQLIAYEVTVTLRNKQTGMMESEGVGCCNSQERRYKNQDKFNVANTLLKMAKKRALVDATLDALGISSLFTQDLEDIEPEPRQNDNRQNAPQNRTGNGSHAPNPPQQTASQMPKPEMATEDDLRIYEEMRTAAIDMGLTPTGALTLGTAPKKVFEQRRAMLDEAIRAKEAEDVAAMKAANDGARDVSESEIRVAVAG